VLVRLAYTLAIAVAAPCVLAWKSLRDRTFAATVPERLGRLPADLPRGGVWIHAASVGEVRAAQRMASRLSGPLVISAMTPAGLALARSLLPSAGVIAAPLDLGPIVGRALDRIAPRLLVIVETEIWPALIHAAAARGIPVVLVSARISDRTERAYRRARALFGPALRAMAAIGAQTQTDRTRLVAAGADPERVRVTGNLKCDTPPGDSAGRSIASIFAGTRPLLVAGSTHAGEEAAALDAWRAASDAAPGLRLVIAPRHLARVPEVNALLESRGVTAVKRSALDGPPPADARVVVLDTIGELDALYGFCDLAFVGGSLVPVGGHNVLEPARHGVPVLFGPHTENFRAETELLLQAGAAIEVADVAAFAREARKLLRDPPRMKAMGEAGRRALEAGRGATERTMTLLAPWLPAGPRDA
jgi:3-deoxy-D-manno-octulosonic-acid transferase